MNMERGGAEGVVDLAVQRNRLRADNEAMAARIERIEEIGKKLQDENVQLRWEMCEQAVREARLRQECDESAAQVGDLKEQLDRERTEHRKTIDTYLKECQEGERRQAEADCLRAELQQLCEQVEAARDADELQRLRGQAEELRELLDNLRASVGESLERLRPVGLHYSGNLADAVDNVARLLVAKTTECGSLREDIVLLKKKLEEARSKSPSPKDEHEIKCLRENERAFSADREAAIAFLNERYKYNEDWCARGSDSPLVKALEAAIKLEAAGHGSDAAERAWTMHAEVTKVLAKYMAEVEKAK